MSSMTVSRLREDGSKEYVEIDITDVDYIQSEGTRIAFYKDEQKYLSIISLQELSEILMPYGFDPLDRSNIVNMKKIRAYDEDERKVYFVDEPNESSTSANIANVKKKHIEPYVYRAIAANKGTTLENIKKQSDSSLTKGIFRHSHSKE